MDDEKIRDILLRGAARSMEAEGANYERVLQRMRIRHQAKLAAKKKKKA